MMAALRLLLTPLLAPLLALLLAACVTPPPAPAARLGLTLAPAALGEAIALQQHLKVERDGRIDELDAALEVDATQLQLVALAFGQRVLSLRYDGVALTSWRHVLLPSQVRAEDVLEDIQLTLWPSAAIASALPQGWRVEDQGLQRTLYMGNAVVAMIDYSQMPRWSGVATLENLRYHYRLTIQSAPAGN
jgi:hypothetical protein